MLAIDRELKALVEKLNEQKIPHALCGGLAMAVHGHPRSTRDIDLVAFRGSTTEIEKIANEMGYKSTAKPMQFAGGQVAIHRVTKTDPESEDFLPLDILTFEPSIENSITFEEADWQGVKLRVVSRKDLIRIKKIRNSHQDQADIEKLSS